MSLLTLVVAESPIPDSPSRDILMALRSRGFEARYIPIARMSATIMRDSVLIETRGGPLNPIGVFVRGLGLLVEVDQFMRRVTLFKILEDAGSVVINPIESLLRSRNKFETLYLLYKSKIPVPETIVTEDLFYAYNAMVRFGEVVVKPIQGSRGFGSVKMGDPDVAFQVFRTLASLRKPLYVQKYVEKPGRDIRVIVVDGEPIGCMYRYAPEGQWKTNIAQGARGEPCRLDSELAELAVRSVEALGLIYGGVDIGETRDGYVIFEVNGSPDWRAFKSVTGVNPAEYLVEALIRRTRR